MWILPNIQEPWTLQKNRICWSFERWKCVFKQKFYVLKSLAWRKNASPLSRSNVGSKIVRISVCREFQENLSLWRKNLCLKGWKNTFYVNKNIVNIYTQSDMKVCTLQMDREFECLRENITGVDLNNNMAWEHNTVIEIHIRFAKKFPQEMRSTPPLKSPDAYLISW